MMNLTLHQAKQQQIIILTGVGSMGRGLGGGIEGGPGVGGMGGEPGV